MYSYYFSKIVSSVNTTDEVSSAKNHWCTRICGSSNATLIYNSLLAFGKLIEYYFKVFIIADCKRKWSILLVLPSLNNKLYNQRNSWPVISANFSTQWHPHLYYSSRLKKKTTTIHLRIMTHIHRDTHKLWKNADISYVGKKIEEIS